VRPTLEYASQVWDGCNEQDEDLIEKFNLEAARIITGLASCSRKEKNLQRIWPTKVK
jgi:hypothetical protein